MTTGPVNLSTPPLLAAIGLADILPAALMLGGLVLLFWAFRRNGGPGLAPPAPRRPDLRQDVRPDRTNQVMRDSQELADLLAAQMDRQAERLERLIAEADGRIRRLERLAAEASRPREPARTTDADPLAARIYDLADQGMPAVEIARSLDQQTGKVELILALRQR